MNRWITIPIAGLALLAAVAHAQVPLRNVPKDVKHGHITISNPPQIDLDGKADRLSPGARIRNVNNLIVMSGTLIGKTVPVVYRREVSGMVHDVWILSPDEESKLGGVGNTDSAQGAQRFADLLAAIFGARR
ncbi:MAG: hypothetical protein ACXWJM_10415 [Ramlibacter sp.]